MKSKETGSFLIMGVLNVTPDSFSDGGQFIDPDNALQKALSLVDDGADIIDIGGESSRPGAQTLDVETEWQRLEPLLKALRQKAPQIRLSIDTCKFEIARRALPYDPEFINNINGLYNKEELTLLARQKTLSYIAMHKKGSPKDMQTQPLTFQQVSNEVEGFFHTAKKELLAAGFSKDQIFLDPGIGFGKTDAANIKLMSQTSQFTTSYNLALGISRKSWIGRTLAIKDPLERDQPSKMMELALAMLGAKLIRTHEVKTLVKLRELFEGVREY